MGLKVFLIKHADKIIFGGKLATGVAAVIFAVKDTPKALKKLDQKEHAKAVKYQEEHPDDENLEGFKGLTRWEKFKTAAPVYWKSYLFGAASIGLDVFSYYRLGKEIDTYKIIATSAITDKDKIVKAVEENVSKDKLNKIKNHIAQEDVNENPPKIETEFREDGTHIFRLFGSDFRADRNEIDYKFNKINSQINQGETFSKAQVKEIFGLPYDKGDELIGWGSTGIPGNIIRYEVIPATDQYGNPMGIIFIKTDPTSVHGYW